MYSGNALESRQSAYTDFGERPGAPSPGQRGVRPGQCMFTRRSLWFQVRQAAFQSLGPFISTFANPSRAGLYIREDGTLSIRPPARGVESGFACGSACAGSCAHAAPAG